MALSGSMPAFVMLPKARDHNFSSQEHTVAAVWCSHLLDGFQVLR